ncbi:hypothetical protein HWV62_24179 [Athelia sp. TMB]|nr:hypothetical protein HWV62_24179 [Athelia sp. TMB]
MDGCYSSTTFPSGIAPWKLLSFSFWPGREHPLGLKWQLSPEDYSALGHGETTYLGYSIENACAQYPIVPHERRKNDAYVLAKLLTFFTVRRNRAWAPEVMDAATHATGVRYVLGAQNDTNEGDWGPVELPKEYVNLGEMGQDAFLESLRHTKVLVGMGNPMPSPTPYDALCLGVPFINQIRDTIAKTAHTGILSMLLSLASLRLMYTTFAQATPRAS